MKKLNYKLISIVIGLIAISGLAVYYVFAAWTPPTAAPPGANVPAPINVGTTTQTFLGNKRLNFTTTTDVLSLGPGLGVDGVLRARSNLIVDGNVGIGTIAPRARLDVAGGDIVITERGITCPIWRDCDADGHTPGRHDCDESCPTCFVGSTHWTTAPDGLDQNCNLVVDETVSLFEYYLFDTAVFFTGNLGGRAGANHSCNIDADKPALCTSPAWAFISVSDPDEIRDMPATRAVDTTRPWYFRDRGHAGVRAANNWADLLDGTVAASPLSGGFTNNWYWTGSTWAGAIGPGGTCAAWSTASADPRAHGGLPAYTDGRWLDGGTLPCNVNCRLICACEVRVTKHF